MTQANQHRSQTHKKKNPKVNRKKEIMRAEINEVENEENRENQ